MLQACQLSRYAKVCLHILNYLFLDLTATLPAGRPALTGAAFLTATAGWATFFCTTGARTTGLDTTGLDTTGLAVNAGAIAKAVNTRAGAGAGAGVSVSVGVGVG